MLQKIVLSILILSLNLVLLAQNEIPSDDYLQWGKIKIPINELVNGTNGSVKMSLKEVLESANEPIVMMKNGEDVKVKSFYLIITKDKLSGSPTFLTIEDYDTKNALNIHGKPFLEKNLKEGERIYFNNLKGKNTEEHFLIIEITYSKTPLKLNFSLPDIPRGEVFGFQILELSNEPLRIKLDTADVAMEKIFNTYKKLDKYQTIHIPKYKTTRRYLTKKNVLDIQSESNFDLVKNKEIKKVNLALLPEFTDYNEFNIELKWGEMLTTDLRRSFSAGGNDGVFMENSAGQIIKFQDYDKYDLQDALGQRFTLSQGYKTYKIKRMKIYIIPKNETPIAYETDDINHPDLEKVFLAIDKNTMILFSDIIIEGDVNELLYFPTSLLFGIR
jgi:hypothetical protein